MLPKLWPIMTLNKFLLPVILATSWTWFHVAMTNATNSSSDPICKTAVCYDIAEQLKNDMKTTVDPCQDFFQFTCGSWYRKHIFSSDHARRFEAPNKVVKRRTQEILESDYGSKYPPTLEEPIAFYNQCKSLALSSPNTIKKIYDFIKLEKLPNLGGFPLISSDWNESDYSLEKALIYLHKDYWINAIYDTDFLYAEKNGSHGKLLISVQNPLQAYGRLFKTNETMGQILKTAVVQNLILPKINGIIKNFFVDQPKFELSEDMKRELKEAKEFTRELVQIAHRSSDDFTENHTLPELSKMFTNVNWTKYYMEVFGSEHIKVNQSIYAHGKTLKELENLLNKTKKRTIANYVAIIFLQKYTSRFEDCSDATREAFPHAIGSVYAHRYLDQKMFNDTLGYIKQVRGIFDKLLDSVTWMDKETRDRAKRKLSRISTTVGYPEMYKMADKLKEYHQGLNIERATDLKTFLKNVDHLFKFQTQSAKRNRLEHRLSYLFHEGAVATNAAYFPLENSIAVFVGILIEPFYHPHRPLAMNYGSLGYIIGHELTHAFDNTGREYDESGNKRNWWTEHSSKGYQERYQCFLRQYAKVAEFEHSPTEYSKFTAGENIADGGGLHESYEAFKELMTKDQSALERLPGELSKYTPHQLFFISFANSYCSYYPEHIKLLTKYLDVHSLDNHRIKGTIMNTKGFAEAFKCPVGSAMNPIKKCTLFE